MDSNCLHFCSVQEGKVGISRVANQLLCIYAHRDVAIGILKAKVKAFVLQFLPNVSRLFL